MRPTGTKSSTVPAALIRLLALLLALSGPAWADRAADEQARRLKRADEGLWQLSFGQRIVAEARKQLGRPYIWGEKDGVRGFDCSGYTAYVFKQLGMTTAPNAVGQFNQGIYIEKASLLPGDLVFFAGNGSPLHVGIYGGDGRFYHAPGAGKTIRASGLDDSYFKNRYLGARRLTPPFRPTPTKEHP
jgi:hypothetical protein